MDKPKIVDRMFQVEDLPAGTYYWCACGLSSKQPFCDGNHKTTSIQPVKFELDKETRVKACMCKHTKKPPYCDGSHSTC